jgi:hypothetical protein
LNGYNASIDVSSLVNITGDYIVTGYDAADDAVSTIGDDVYFNYDGPYNSNIAVADNIYLYTNSETTTAVGTSAISFMSLIKVAGVQTVDASGVTTHTSGGGHTSGGSVSVSTGTVVLSSSSATNALNLTDATTSVKIAQAPITYVYGDGLETLELHYAAAATTASPALSFLTINGSALTSATVKAENISGAISVTAKSTGSTLNMNDIESVVTFTSNAATNNLTGLTSATTFTSTGVTSNDLSALASATTLNLAAASNNLSSLASATTITSSGADHNFAALATVGTLTLSGDTTPSLPALTAATGNITLAAATSLSFPELATATNITGASATGTVTFPSLTSGNTMTFASASGFTARLATVDVIDLDATEDLSIDVASFDFTDGATELPDMASIVSLTLRNQATSIVSSYLAGLESATTLSINAKDVTTQDANGRPGVDITLSGSATNYESLTTLVVTGVVDELSVSGMTALTDLTTGGTMNMVTIDSNPVITDGLNFGHVDSPELGTYLRVTSNALLETFTTSSNRPYHFVVTGNPKLASFDASSFTAMPNWYDELGNSVTPWWTLNASSYVVSGNYAGTGTTTATGMIGSYVSDTSSTDETFKEDSLNSLKPLLTLLYNGLYEGTTPYAGWLGATKTLTITLDYLAPANTSEVSSGQYATGTYQARSIVLADGEVADITAE